LTKTKLLLKKKPSKKKFLKYTNFIGGTPPKTTHVAPDIRIQNEPNITNHHKFNASSHKWNFDGIT